MVKEGEEFIHKSISFPVDNGVNPLPLILQALKLEIKPEAGLRKLSDNDQEGKLNLLSRN